ncbi:preprotein translocase subunit YajC [Desulfobacca acetoxidans]|uniref:Sec translocon accessory complex subunit YajC n=1 Tax=Desulfobacca acetoxidans (strain ATCC 700848 / DSM 11109 / ASRB2) TaxID=880072 RepID=F2NDW5_DESAR|nr:preprotein translocase, YajC subunit [Desulfobacca acetoxidans DSM 11109]
MEVHTVVDLAYAMAGASGEAGGSSGLLTILPLILMFGIFYVLLIRPQQKKAKEHRSFLENLKKGDKVVTAGGLYGEITGMTDQSVTLEIADRIRVKVGRGYIANFAPKE